MNPHEQFVVGWDHLLGLPRVVEVHPGDPAIRVYFEADALDEVGSERLLAVLLQIEHDFVPALVEFERHRAFEGFDAGDGLVVAGDEGSADVLVVEDGDLEAEVLLELSCENFTFLTNKTKMGIFILRLALGLLGMIR